MMVMGPKHRPDEWDSRMREAVGPDATIVQKTGEFEFAALSEEDKRNYKVRFVGPDSGDGHDLELYQSWEMQKMKMRLAFGRPMVPDEARQIRQIRRRISSRPDI
jgi:hypothetical protein